MTKTVKKIALFVTSLLSVGALAIAVPMTKATNVQAAEVEVPYEVLGAGVRLGEYGGIRFGVSVAKSYIDELATDTQKAVVLHSSVDKKGGSTYQDVATWSLNGDESVYDTLFATNTFYHTISYSSLSGSELLQASAVDLTATIWLTVDNVEVEGTKQEVTRSMRLVANAAYDQVKDDAQSELDKYLGTRTNLTSDSYAEVTIDETTGVTNVSKLILPKGVTETTSQYAGLELLESADTGYTISKAKELGQWETLSIFDESNNVYNLPIIYATNAIEDYSEFQTACGYGKDKGEITGYLVLTKDINNKGKAFSHYRSGDCSWKATFDGNGFSVKIKIDNNYGIFGTLKAGAVIKNTKFEVTYTNPETATEGKILSDKVSSSTDDVLLENLYIQSDSTQAVERPALIGGGRSIRLKMKNVIWDANFTLEAGAIYKNYGLFAYDTYTDLDGSGQLENVYMISSAITHVAHSDQAVIWYAANDTALKESEATTYTKQYQYADGTVYRYETASAMAGEGKTQVGNWSIAQDGTVSWVETPSVNG